MFDISNLSKIKKGITRSISAENPDGKTSGGALAEPGEKSFSRNLGKGWKVRPCIKIKSGEMVEIANIENNGQINHIWFTLDSKFYRSTIIRFYWDGEVYPSIEVPTGDFFGCTHGLQYNLISLPVSVNPRGGLNCYWPMPFKKSARITIENIDEKDVSEFFYQIDYCEKEIDGDEAYFHARWNRSTTSRENPEHIILENVKGEGHYVGTVIGWTQFSNGWWGEGEVKFFLEGEKNPTICTTGTEDYFGGAWGFEETFNSPFCGYPLWRKEMGEVPRHGLYRWHITDPVIFRKELKVSIQALGWWPNSTFQPLTDDISSVGYWYQKEPHFKFDKKFYLEELWSR